MSGIDVLRVQDKDLDTVTITVGSRWVEIPTCEVDTLVMQLQQEVAA